MLPAEDLELVGEALSYCATTGILMASQLHDNTYSHAPISLMPNDFPAREYAKAIRLAPLFNSLVRVPGPSLLDADNHLVVFDASHPLHVSQVEAVAADGPWMLDVLKGVLPHDDFTKRLVDLYVAVNNKGSLLQKVQLGINRSDYMLHGEVRVARGLRTKGQAPDASCEATHPAKQIICLPRNDGMFSLPAS